MSDCDCYKEIEKFVKEYVETLVGSDESIEVGLHKGFGVDCYISINYNKIINKKHIEKFVHLDPYFLEKTVTKDCVKLIVDDIINRWRK